MNQPNVLKTARIAGLWYLGLAVTGVLGVMVVHPHVFSTSDPVKTLLNLTEHETLARIRLLLEFGIILTQALAAVWFYKLFKETNAWAAWALGIWGTVNALVIMVSAIAMAASIDLATSSLTQPEKIALVQLLTSVSSNAWGVGSLFFGLWLFPMGYLVIEIKTMPVWLGRTLLMGGVGYVLSTLIKYLGYTHSLVDLMVIPASVGEFWIVGYLLMYGVNQTGLIKKTE